MTIESRPIWSCVVSPRYYLLYVVISAWAFLQPWLNRTHAQVSSGDEPSSPQRYMADGRTFYDRGDVQQAIQSWGRAAKLFSVIGDFRQQVEALANVSSAHLAIGQYDQAIAKLNNALSLAEKLKDSTITAQLLGNLGNAYHRSGQYVEAHKYASRGLKLAEELQNFSVMAGILNTLGNVYVDRKEYQKAIDTYRDCVQLANQNKDVLLEAKALTNSSMILIKMGHYQEAHSSLDKAEGPCQSLPSSHDKASILLTIGLAFNDLRPHLSGINDALLLRSFEAFVRASEVANELGDRRLRSYAQGYLGQLYEEENRYNEALEFTHLAIFAAQQVQAPESLYLWQWQSGRLLAKMGKRENAISAYRRTVHTIQSIRQEMSDQPGCGESSFRESIGPAYLELVDLLLQHSVSLSDPQRVQDYLSDARQYIELLKADDLKDYFDDECIAAVRAKTINLDTVSQTAIVIYPILLPDRTELLVSLSSGLERIKVDVTAEILSAEARQFQRLLKHRGLHEYLPKAQKLYDWLIRPLEPYLGTTAVDTLVFVPDGPLRMIPMAALHDGKEFLINRFALAITPGLDLTDPQKIERERLKVLAAGLTESVQGFPALPHVSLELDKISEVYNAQLLEDQAFTDPGLEKEMKDKRFSIIHIASHGQFKSNAEDTFILTFDGKLTIDRLNHLVGLFRYRDDPLELLTLSACETAAGDDRAALGLAGLAIKAGARAALGTLWVVDDQASSLLVSEFYQQLQDASVSRANALQRAQIHLINDDRYNHPYYWSPFLLINNWL